MDSINPPWAAQTTVGEPPRIAVSIPDARFAHLGWPKALQLTDGTVLLAFLAGETHIAGGSPAVAISTDGGRTFSDPHILEAFDDSKEFRHSGNLAIGVAADGAVVLLAMAFTKSNAHIFGWRSRDLGRTWTPTDNRKLGPQKTGSVFGNLVQLPDQRLLAVGHYRPGSQPYESGIWMAESRDHGASWEEPRRILDLVCVEPLLVRAASGRLLLFLRHDVPADMEGSQSLAWSDDDGLSWQLQLKAFMADDPSSQRLAAPFAYPDPEDPEQLLVMLTTRSRSTSTNWGKWTPGDIALWRGSVRNLQFKRVRTLLKVPFIEGDLNQDFGYPWLIHLGQQSYRIYYYHGEILGSCALWRFDAEL